MTAALDVGEWTAACPDRTLPPRKTQYSFYRRLGGPQGRSELEENLVPPGFFSNIYCTFNHIYRNLTSLLPRVLAVRFPSNVM